MTPLQRSRRLQAGLAGLGIAGALGASIGIGMATRSAADDTSTRSGKHSSGSERSSSGSEHRSSRTTTRSSTGTSRPTVTAPTPSAPSAPQATTSGS
ncbi:MAG TPA: hypothetical protein VHR85_07945 [Nocardioides sp.]|nr:hypothetical protein [Nocardioides sp.]